MSLKVNEVREHSAWMWTDIAYVQGMCFDESRKEKEKASWKWGKWKCACAMHECGQLLLVFKAYALMKVERKEEREDESAQVWT